MTMPYRPSPLYLYRRSKFHAPRPARMSGFGNYTHGVFSAGEKYAIPDYVAEEKTGLEGCNGCNLAFSGYEVETECNVDIFKNKISDIISGVFPFPANNIVKEIVKIQLSQLSNDVFTELLNLSSKGYSSYKSYFDKYVRSSLISKLKSSNELQFVVNMLSGLIDEAAKSVYDYAVTFLKSCRGDDKTAEKALEYLFGKASEAAKIAEQERLKRTAEILASLSKEQYQMISFDKSGNVIPQNQDFNIPTKTSAAVPVIIGASALLAYLVMG